MRRESSKAVAEGYAQSRALRKATREARDARIRRLLLEGMKSAEVARAVGVAPSVVCRVKKGE